MLFRSIGCDVVIASRLPFEIPIKKADVILWLPKGNGHRRCDMSTLKEGESNRSISGEANQHDRKIRVYCHNNPELSSGLLAFLNEYPCNFLPLVRGSVILTTNEREISLEIPEASIIVEDLSKLTPNIEDIEVEKL